MSLLFPRTQSRARHQSFLVAKVPARVFLKATNQGFDFRQFFAVCNKFGEFVGHGEQAPMLLIDGVISGFDTGVPIEKRHVSPTKSPTAPCWTVCRRVSLKSHYP
ncbi:hypothetical protein SAMN05428963_101348 [Consotaella salsifontis]|uniref:Uncharacterized protein n=1 Tax=Consotaella salsifontis TaxID=1365950 RepID=A0A1T4LSP0_9HYPH|nr:hypothetical protein SAMN05428963_101348 [Consotaella salsifontis]